MFRFLRLLICCLWSITLVNGWTLLSSSTTRRSRPAVHQRWTPPPQPQQVLLYSQNEPPSAEGEGGMERIPMKKEEEDQQQQQQQKLETMTSTTTTTTATMAPPEILLGEAIVDEEEEDEETPAGIVGSQFFGGNKQKEELYDPVAEMEASVEEWSGVYERFATFSADGDQDIAVTSLCQSLQQQLQQVLQRTSDVTKKQLKQLKQQQQQQQHDTTTTTSSSSSSSNYYYSPNLQWETPLWQGDTSNMDPLQALQQAKDFYNRLDVGIVSGQRLVNNNVVEVRWEISVVWPTLWEPRVLLTGYSHLTLDWTTRTIVRQVDVVDAPDFLSTILHQLLPRFWDLYHIGMTPSAELAPRQRRRVAPSSVFQSNFFSSFLPKSYQVWELPSRWVLQPTRLDTKGRDDAAAQVLPNHAFSTSIKTVGPQRQRYVPTSPIQVQIVPPPPPESSSLSSLAPSSSSEERDNGDSDLTIVTTTTTTPSSPSTTTPSSSSSTLPWIVWKIPLSVEFMAQLRWPLPGDDVEAEPGSAPSSAYVLDPRRRIATIPFGKSPQDPDVALARKQLYEAVTRDGYALRLDGAGRPQFFYLQHDCKACFTAQGGLGMSVYEWRPQWVQTNEIGIELELE